MDELPTGSDEVEKDQSKADQELARLYLSDPSNEAVRENFAKRSLELLRAMVRACVFKTNFCPRFMHPETFAEDVYSLAATKFAKGMHQLSAPEAFYSWLKASARFAVIEEYDSIYKRGETRPIIVSMDSLLGGGAEERKEAAHTEAEEQAHHSRTMFQSKYWVDPSELVQERERGELLEKLLTLYAQSSPRAGECTVVIRIKRDEDLTIEDVATKCGRSSRTIHRLLRHDWSELAKLAGELHITP